MAQVQVRNREGAAVTLINIRATVGHSEDGFTDDRFTDLAGNTAFGHTMPPSAEGYTLRVNVANVNPKYRARTIHISDFHDDVHITLPRERLRRLHMYRQIFVDDIGQRVFILGHTDFLLYKRFLDGEYIESLLAERARYGSNCARIIGMVNSFAHWYPQEYGQRYYDAIPAFFDLLDRYGMYGYFTVFADTEIVMPRKADQLAHFDKVVAQLKACPNSLGELVNEPYAHQNATADPMAFTRPEGVPFSSGSYNDELGGDVTPPPHWDFHDFHVPRKDVKRVADQCMSTHPNYRTLGQGVFSGESDKFGGPNVFNPKVYLTDPEVARQMARTAEGTACGYIYHTSGGVWSLPWNDAEKACAEATFSS